MTVMVRLTWAGITPQKYDAVLDLVGWERQPPKGAIYHVCSFDDAGICVTDVWASAADFQRFIDERLMPGVVQVGITGQPDVVITEAYRTFAPAYQQITLPEQAKSKAGASSRGKSRAKS